MLNLLVMVEDSPVSESALEGACRLDPGNRVHPIFMAPPSGHELAMGAGWAWKTWERENRYRAGKDLEDLVSVHRQQCRNLKASAVVSGRPVKAVSHHFHENGYDLVVAGVPFRGMSPHRLAHRFQRTLRNHSRDLPLWMVSDARPVRTVTALTDGGYPAEKALGFLNRLAYRLDIQITLIGLNKTSDRSPARENLNLERGFAIFREKGIDARGFTSNGMDAKALNALLSETDMLVLPYASTACIRLFDRSEADIASVLFYLDAERD